MGKLLLICNDRNTEMSWTGQLGDRSENLYVTYDAQQATETLSAIEREQLEPPKLILWDSQCYCEHFFEYLSESEFYKGTKLFMIIGKDANFVVPEAYRSLIDEIILKPLTSEKLKIAKSNL